MPLPSEGPGPVEHAGPRAPIPDLSTVYREHVAFAWRVVRRCGVDADAVPDVVQDVFLVVRRRLPDYDGRAPMQAWIAGICRGVALNHRRGVQRRARRLRVVGEAQPPSDMPLERFELGRTLAVALAELEVEQRLAIVLADIEGLSPADVADIMGVSRNTVYSRLRLARQKVRDFLQGLGRGRATKEG